MAGHIYRFVAGGLIVSSFAFVGDLHLGHRLGSIGLIFFAFIVWKFLPTSNAVFVLTAALALWLLSVVVLWRARRLRLPSRHRTA